ncbi:NAD-dependent epimerase/dehydratase family protein [Chondromyces crocatus]|uniref:UDP-glucose 4-epimerase n=1 Tax=Chondromyces crocatus TaxID=52 RepID=A0A0K1EHN6_CHOCO|nr:NAD-dependent epimerase/dehydratase family protein [Chondromyces crocatus]AKT40088.1 UDP-glucose 4-epimerase [Chondromyces crocatus]
MKSFVIGGAGFIGSHLVDRLVARGPVTVYDNLSVGRRDFIAAHLDAGRATLVQADVLDLERLTEALTGHDVVFHLAANPEARWGLTNTRLDLEQGTIATWNVLEAMRRAGVPRLVFSSSGTVYGDTEHVAAEDDLGALPISLYGASKLAGEALISAFTDCFGLRAHVFRFGNVVGPRGTHGAALDFLKKLREHKTELEVLGDGRQAKPYLHVHDCADGILFGLDHPPPDERLPTFNLAPPDVTSVARIAALCIAASPYPEAVIRYTGGDRGWPGDVPRSRMNPGKLAARGFRVRYTSDEAVRLAVEALATEVFPPKSTASGVS